MKSEFEALGAKLNAERMASAALCKSISVVVAELNSGIPVGSEMVKGQLSSFG